MEFQTWEIFRKTSWIAKEFTVAKYQLTVSIVYRVRALQLFRTKRNNKSHINFVEIIS